MSVPVYLWSQRNKKLISKNKNALMRWRRTSDEEMFNLYRNSWYVKRGFQINCLLQNNEGMTILSVMKLHVVLQSLFSLRGRFIFLSHTNTARTTYLGVSYIYF